MTRPIVVLAVVACAYGQPVGQLASRDNQEPRTESLLGNLAPIAQSIHNERGFPLAHEHRGNLPFADWPAGKLARTSGCAGRCCGSAKTLR